MWQSIGGQELGSIWGHGAYVAPDWSADWLHRECVWILDRWSQAEHGKRFQELDQIQQAELTARLKQEMRPNTYDPKSGDLVILPDRAAAAEALGRYYASIFGDAAEFDEDIQPLADGGRSAAELREAYSIPALTVCDPERQRQMNAFFFWTAWACATERPAEQQPNARTDESPRRLQGITYTNNWPSEELIGNVPSGQIVV